MPMRVIDWHPWFCKPERLDIRPGRMYPRGAPGIAVLPTQVPSASLWDDCVINPEQVVLGHGGRIRRLASGRDRWVVCDQAAHATGVEPQSGPPDVFDLAPAPPASGASVEAWFRFVWK